MKTVNQPYIIAEIGQAHDGSLGYAHSFIDALKGSGVDAIKFQMHLADFESSDKELFRVPFSYEDDTRADYWKRMEFSFDQWVALKKHCEKNGFDFLCSPFSCESVKILEKLNVNSYKIGSGCVTNLLLLKTISLTKKPIILSTGLSSIIELKNAINILNYNDSDISIMHCVSKYPTPYSTISLNKLDDLKNEFPNNKIGFSDHSGSIYPIYAASVKGAELVEFHVTFDKRAFGPDSLSSLTIDQTFELVRELKSLKTLLKSDVTDDKQKEKYKSLFGYSLAVNRDVMANEMIDFSMLESKKPIGCGIDAAQYDFVIGKTLKNNLGKHSYISMEDLND